MTEKPMDKLTQCLTKISKDWECSNCGKSKPKSIELFYLDNDQILECIICDNCKNDDHTAIMKLSIKFDDVK